MLEQIRAHARARFFSPGVPFGKLFFVFRGALARVGFLLFDFRSFFLQFELSGFYIFLASLGVDHQLEDLVFIGADVALGKLNFVQKRLILLVGFYFERLVAVFGDLTLQVLNCSFVVAARRFIGFDGGFGRFQAGFGSCQLLFDGSHALRQRRNFFF